MTDVALKEHLEALIRNERELREAEARQVAQALGLQAREIERRLDNLNHAHERANEMAREFLRQETFDDYRKSQTVAAEVKLKEETEWRRMVDNQLSEQRGASARTIAIVTIVLALLSIALRFWP